MNRQSVVESWLAEARRQGWTVTKGTGGHWRGTPPPGHPEMSQFTAPSSPGKGRSLHNVRADMRRAGVVLQSNEERRRSRGDRLADLRAEAAAAAASERAKAEAANARRRAYEELGLDNPEALVLVRQDTATQHGMAALAARREESTMTNTPTEAKAAKAKKPRTNLKPPKPGLITLPMVVDRYGASAFSVRKAIDAGYLAPAATTGTKRAFHWFDPDAADRAPILGTTQAAAYAGVDYKRMDKARHLKELESVRVQGSYYYFRPCDVRTWAARQKPPVAAKEAAAPTPPEGLLPTPSEAPVASENPPATTTPVPPVVAPVAPDARLYEAVRELREGRVLLVDDEGGLWVATPLEVG